MSSPQEREFIKIELSKLSCPFTWQLEEAARYYFTVSTLAKTAENDDIDEEAHLLLEQFVMYLVIFYERLIFGEMDRAYRKLKDCESTLTEMRKKEDDRDIMRAIEHIFNATMCHYYFEMNKIKELQVILPSITKITDLNDIELGALNGCQCIAWSTYTDFGIEKTTYFAQEAIKLDPDKALWHFIFAKNLRRLRRAINIKSLPLENERRHFELAYQKCENPVFGIYLAQMHHECIYHMPLRDRTIYEKDLLELYETILPISKNNYKVLLKLALGFIRISGTNESERAKYCLDLVEKIVPNNSTYFHYRGIYLSKFGNGMEALEYLKKACDLYNYVAEVHYVKIGWKLGLVDPLSHLQSMLSKYSILPKERQQHMHLDLAICYYKKNDMKNALVHYLNALNIDPQSSRLKEEYNFLNFSTKSYRHGIYSFLKQTFLMDAKNCEEYRQRNSSFMDLYSKLKSLCQLHGNMFTNTNKLLPQNIS